MADSNAGELMRDVGVRGAAKSLLTFDQLASAPVPLAWDIKRLTSNHAVGTAYAQIGGWTWALDANSVYAWRMMLTYTMASGLTNNYVNTYFDGSGGAVGGWRSLRFGTGSIAQARVRSSGYVSTVGTNDRELVDGTSGSITFTGVIKTTNAGNFVLRALRDSGNSTFTINAQSVARVLKVA